MAKIILFEDNSLEVGKIVPCLRDDGHEVTAYGEGSGGLQIVRDQRPELIILDIMMPGLDGLTLCRMLQRDQNTQHIPIIMLTARGTEMDKIVGLESGADDYLVKPVSIGELLARVKAVLRRGVKKMVVGDELESENLSLGIMSRKAFKDGVELRLSNKEFDLLAHLMRNKGVVLSRGLILSQVWGMDAFVDKRTVDVHVRWLREKIEENPSDPTRISTVRGVGYRFER